MKLKTLLLIAGALLITGAVTAANDNQPRIYINPGHGGWGPNDRPLATIPYPNTSTGRPDTCGFYESNTNLWKCIKMRETLIKMGLDEDNIMMSHWNVGPYPYDDITYHSGTGNYSRNLTEICEEVDANDIDFFVSVHSNAASDGSTANYPIFLYRGENATEFAAGSKAIATALWGPHWMDEIDYMSTSTYSRTKPYIAADIDFMGSSSTRYSSVTGKSYKGYYGVLKHGSPGFIVEGFFHTYHPTRHRALNEQFCWEEGVRMARGCANYWNLTPESTGYIMGTIKDQNNALTNSLYTYKAGSMDAYAPINGAVVKLFKGEQYVGTYVTDNNYNGIFYFEGLEPGSDYYLDIKASGFNNLVHQGPYTVAANSTSYPALYMTQGTATGMGASDYAPALRQEYADWNIDALNGLTVRRVLAHEGQLIVLAVEGDTYHTPHILQINPVTRAVTREISIAGIANVQDDNNAGSHLYTVSDIAITADGKLLACNQEENQSSAGQVTSGTSRGTFRVYKWDALDGAPSLWFTSPTGEFSSGHWYNADVGHSMAYNGTSNKGQLITSATTIGASRQIRFQNYVVRNGQMVRYFANYDYDNSANRGAQSAATYGEDFKLSPSPARTDQFIIDGSLIAPQEVRVNTTALKSLKDMGNLPSHGAGASGLSTVSLPDGRVLMLEPAVSGGNSTGVWCYDISGGLAHGETVGTDDMTLNAGTYTTAFTAGAVTDGVLSVYLLRDARLSRWVAGNAPAVTGDEVGIFAYDLSLAQTTDGYTFNFRCNNDATEARLIFSDASTGVVIDSLELEGVVKGNNQFHFTNEQLPGSNNQVMKWAVNVHGRQITEIRRLNGSATDADYAFHRAAVAVDRSPESEHFGTVYVSDMATRNASRTSSANRDNGIYRFDAMWQRDNALPFTGNMAWDNDFRLAVDYRGRIYIPDFGDNHAGLYIADPNNLSGDYTQFFAGERNSAGLFTHNGVNTGSSAPSVSIVGSGADTKMYVSLEDMDAQVYMYDLGAAIDADGNLPSTWTTAPTQVNSYTKMGSLVNVNLLAMPDGGLWVSVGNYTNTATSPALRYITPDHSDYWTYCTGRQAADNLDGCAGGGMAISNDGNTLVIANKEGVLQFYRIDWGTDRTKPQLTWLNSFTPDARDVYNATFNSGGHNSYGVYQMACDWGGNLLVAGSNLGVYSIPTTDNQSTTPARSALTVTKVELNPTVTVTGYVYAQGHNQPSAKRRAASGTPLKDVYIVFRDGDNQEYSTTSDASGAYSIDIPAGTYDVEASKSGYYNYSATAVEINSDNSSLDITLAGIVTAIDEADVAQVSVRGAVGCIHVSATEPTHILVCDTSGRVLTQQRVEAGETTIGDLRPGIYIVNRQKVIVR